MDVKVMRRGFLNRILGRCATRKPADPGCFEMVEAELVLGLDRAPELAKPGGALRLEGAGLPFRVLVVHGDDGEFHAFRNKCAHAGRRLDPVPGTKTVQCCSVGHSTYDYQGRLLAGSAKSDVYALPVRNRDGKLAVGLEA